MKWLIVLFFPLIIIAQTSLTTNQLTLLLDKNKQILKTNPNNVAAIEKAGDCCGQMKKWEESLGYYKQLVVLKPNVANYHYKYGGVLSMRALEVNKFKALGMISEIRGSFEKAIQLDPKHIEARWALIELNLQLPGIVGGSESKAIQYSNELLKLSPVDGYLSRGKIEEYFDRYENAEICYRKAIVVGGSKTTYQALANLYKNKMDAPEKAKAVLKEYENRKK